MTLDNDAFAPLSDEEAQAPAAKKKVERTPIVPVPADAPPCTFKIPALGGAPKRMWEYRDAEGRLLGYDARFEYVEDGKACKDVLPVTFCQDGEKQAWRSKALPAPRPLYGLDRLAARRDAPVVIAEGAKSADAAGELLPDYVAVSWQGGSNAIGHAAWRALQGRNVLIWPDRDRQRELDGTEKPYEDQPGTIAAENILARLKDVAGSLRVLDLSGFECEAKWDAADAINDGWDAARAAEFVAAYAVEIDMTAPGTSMPFNFEHGNDGLYYIESESRRMRICGRLKVLAKTRDPSGGSWGLLLEWRDDDGTTHRWAMPKAMLAGDGGMVREALFDRGLFVSTDPKAKARLLEFLSTVDTPIRARAVSQVGWAGATAAFALPHITIGDTPTDRVIYQQADASAHQYLAGGTLEEWQRHVATPAAGNSRLVFMIAAAFVGPILAPAREEGGGINLTGSSSTGKTTGLDAAASVWGPRKFVRTWRATGNGLEGVAAQHSETLLCLDELGELDPKEAGAVAYMLANGQGKTRASRTGSSRVAATWKVLYLSTGEIGIADLAREGRQGRAPQAGQEVRILDVPADAGKGMGAFEDIHGAESPAAFSRQIKSAAEKYHGTAAIAFLEQLVTIRDQIAEGIATVVSTFIANVVPTDADGQVQRAARRFALVAAAGELAIARGILPWGRGEVIAASRAMFDAWLDRRGGCGSAEDRAVIQRLAAFLQAHGDSRFSPAASYEEDNARRPVINRSGFWRNALHATDTVREYLITTEAFKEIFLGLELRHATTLLHDAGILIKDGGGKNSTSIYIGGLGQHRYYVIRDVGISNEQ